MMSSWKDVGEWLKANAGTGAALVGSLLTGNVAGAVAAGISLVSGATGTAEPDKALQALQNDPAAVLKLKELAFQNEASIREHIRAMEELRLKDEADAQKETQTTIRAGDIAEDEYVRHTRPMMARQSWYVTGAYVVIAELCRLWITGFAGASVEVALLLATPAFAYLGLRQIGKGIDAFNGIVRK